MTKRSPSGTSSARWPIASHGSVPTPVSSASSRSSLRWVCASSSKVVQRWPSSGTYWRSSVQIGQCVGRRGGVGELGGAGGADVAGHGRPRLPNQLAARQAMPTRMATAATARLDVSPSPSTRVPSSETMTIDASRPGRHDGDGRERQRDEHEDVGQRAERADGEDRAAVVGQGGAQPLAVAQRGHGEDERARHLRAPVVGDRRLREVLDRVRVPERVRRDRRPGQQREGDRARATASRGRRRRARSRRRR